MYIFDEPCGLVSNDDTVSQSTGHNRFLLYWQDPMLTALTLSLVLIQLSPSTASRPQTLCASTAVIVLLEIRLKDAGTNQTKETVQECLLYLRSIVCFSILKMVTIVEIINNYDWFGSISH